MSRIIETRLSTRGDDSIYSPKPSLSDDFILSPLSPLKLPSPVKDLKGPRIVTPLKQTQDENRLVSGLSLQKEVVASATEKMSSGKVSLNVNADFTSAQSLSFSEDLDKANKELDLKYADEDKDKDMPPSLFTKPLPPIPRPSDKGTLKSQRSQKSDEKSTTATNYLSKTNTRDENGDDTGVQDAEKTRMSSISVVFSPKKKSRPVTMQEMLYGQGQGHEKTIHKVEVTDMEIKVCDRFFVVLF